MRVAILISGQLRSFKSAFATLKKCIIDPNKADLFISVQKSADISLLQDIEYKMCKISEDVFIDEKKYADITFGNVSSVQGLLQQMWYLYDASLLKKEYEDRNKFKYDWVIRVRPDSFFLDQLVIEENWDTNFIYVPDHALYNGINDRFAIGSSENMDIYARKFLEFEKDLEVGFPFHAEIGLLAHLRRHKIDFKKIKVDSALLRATGLTVDFTPYNLYSIPIEDNIIKESKISLGVVAYRANDFMSELKYQLY